MLQTPEETQRTLERMLTFIEGESRSDDISGPNKRSEWRRQFRMPCELHLFPANCRPATIVEASTRNLSFLGIGVVAALDKPLSRGRPIEIEVPRPSSDGCTYVAGTVGFCREVKPGWYELGVEVKASSENPILTQDLRAARSVYDWFATALDTAE